jgi:hypothetical protein
MRLNSDNDIKIESLDKTHQEMLILAHDQARSQIKMLVRGIFLGRGNPNFIGFHEDIRWFKGISLPQPR